MPPSAPASALRTLVAGLVDYAGLFPPAALTMADAVREYAACHAAPEAFMLGRFVVPVGRLDELAAERARCPLAPGGPWRVALLAGADLQADIAVLRAFNDAHRGALAIDVVEARLTLPGAVESAARAVGEHATLYVELPVADEPRPFLDAVRAAGVRAKVRTGGLVAEAFPSSMQLARFIVRCEELGVPWKATAGLHHPLRGEHRLTYAADAPAGTMFGFLNVFAAAAFVREGVREADVVALLEERDPRALAFDDDALRWRGHAVSLARLAGVRASFATSFGSCSFREPADELHQLGYL